MMPGSTERVREESIWFGSEDRTLFGRLTLPTGGEARGGVVLSPPIGRESRFARRAFRTLAIDLAFAGYASIRFDHFGTGDSTGSMNEGEFDDAWIEGIDHASAFLRSLGISTLSAVGMRMGATILGTAAAKQDLGFASAVMWDPCDTGRSYYRELGALGAIRRDATKPGVIGTAEMLEYALSDVAVKRLNGLSLIESDPRTLAERVLIVVRDDRTVSTKFRSIFDVDNVEWAATSEQASLLETELPTSVQPTSTIARIREWLTAPEAPPTSISISPSTRDAVVMEGTGAFPVRESSVELGARKMFGIVSEPVGDVHGPLIVMVNGINEDHVGPSRLWVDLSRRWASLGMRSIRFDCNELGESPWQPSQPNRLVFDTSLRQDIINAVRALNVDHPGDSVLIGLCSGAQLALEAALELEARGVCAINPQVAAGVLRGADNLRNSERESVRTFTRSFESFLKRHEWLGEIILRVSRVSLLSAYSPKVRSALAKNHTEMLLLLSPEDHSPFGRIPIVGSLDHRRLVSSEYVHVRTVPGLDHDFLNTVGRSRAIAILDSYVLKTFGDVN
jgi:dienelactone hydrolase